MAIQIPTATGTVMIDGTFEMTLLSGALPDYVGTQPIWKPPVAPDANAGEGAEPQVLSASFGDGYEAVAPLGLNHIRDTAAYNWSLLTEEQFAAMNAFLRARGGYEPFWYAPPGDPIRQWRCRQWQPGRRGGLYRTLAATLIRSFVPVA